MTHIPQQDTPPRFGASLWSYRNGKEEVGVTVVANSVDEVIKKLRAKVADTPLLKIEGRKVRRKANKK